MGQILTGDYHRIYLLIFSLGQQLTLDLWNYLVHLVIWALKLWNHLIIVSSTCDIV